MKELMKEELQRETEKNCPLLDETLSMETGFRGRGDQQNGQCVLCYTFYAVYMVDSVLCFECKCRGLMNRK